MFALKTAIILMQLTWKSFPKKANVVEFVFIVNAEFLTTAFNLATALELSAVTNKPPRLLCIEFAR